MHSTDYQQDEVVISVLAAILRDAHRTAELAVSFLDEFGPSLKDEQSSWPAGFLLELGAVLRLRQWEEAGIKTAIDADLPNSQDALADLTRRLRTGCDQLERCEAPLLRKVFVAWWSRCAHPIDGVLPVDVVFSRVNSNQLLSCVARLLWQVRNVDVRGSEAGHCDDRHVENGE